MTRKLILLTGASGYVGGRLLGRLERRGLPVRCLARRPDFLARRAGPTTQVVEADVLREETLAPALEGGYGVGCFNVFGWEDAAAVVQAGEALQAPVILSANLDLRGFMPLEVIAGMFRALGKAASVPVCAHLDHTYVVDEVLRAVDAGFTSVMFDGSQLPLEENILKTQRVADYAHAAGASAEAEIGSVPYAEGRDHIVAALTDVYGKVPKDILA